MEYPFMRSRLYQIHLRRSINNNDKDEILLVYNRRFPFKAHSSASPDIELVNFIKFPVNFPSKKAHLKEIEIIGSANGLICFYVGYYDSVIHIWNPSLSALLTVPPSCINYNINIWHGSRFGYDPKNDDYKIIELLQPDKERLRVGVYSMRSGCWKLITPCPPSHVVSRYYHGDDHLSADGHDGNLHWFCTDEAMKIQNILAFDLADESFSEISLPDCIKFDSIGRHTLGVFGGKLCVISESVDRCHCELWVLMDKYGSWVKDGFTHFHKDGLYPYGFTLKNNFLYYESLNELVYLYDPAATFNKVKSFPKNTLAKRYINEYHIIPYVESLVWVTPPTC